jgi:FkbM family methyltransferase
VNTEIKQFVHSQLEEKDNPVILEIGAHYGEDTIDMFNAFNNPTVHCFDPDPRNAAFFKKYFEISDNSAKYKLGLIYFYEVALSNKNEEMDFFMAYTDYPEDQEIPKKYKWVGEENFRELKLNASGASSLKLGDAIVNDAESVKVKAVTLDSWAEGAKVDMVDFIWMDVQGAESDVVSGGEKTLKNTKFVWTEYGETQYEGGMNRKQTTKLFESLGFSPVKRDRNNLLFRNNSFK